LHNIQLKKEFNFLIGKHNEISLEKYILKIIREKKKKLIKSKSNLIDKNLFSKIKKEPEKNKTHWDILLSEMKWMQSDYEKARREGERAYRRAVASGQYPYLPALNSMGRAIDKMAVRKLAVKEILLVLLMVFKHLVEFKHIDCIRTVNKLGMALFKHLAGEVV
jgi:hypothetical protein